MKIIDSHIHFFKEPHFDRLAREAHHENSAEHLRKTFGDLGIELAIVMGNRDLDLARHVYPDFMRYCVGLDSYYFTEDKAAEALELVEQHFERPACVGLKLYPGYNTNYVYDDVYKPFLELADHCKKPVAIHTGETAGSHGLLKYSHPLTLDEVACKYPNVRFIMCHLGNPWLVDAAVVINKNHNVSADLSGFLVGKLEMRRYFEDNRGYVEYIKTWLQYMSAWDRLMYGTDWPLPNMGDYIEFIAALVPARYHDMVFYQNAAQTYGV